MVVQAHPGTRSSLSARSFPAKKGQEESQLHWPGIEPGPPAWQARILPLNHQCAPHTEKKGRKMRNHQDRAVAKGSTEKNGRKTSNPQMVTFEPPHLCPKVFFCNLM